MADGEDDYADEYQQDEPAAESEAYASVNSDALVRRDDGDEEDAALPALPQHSAGSSGGALASIHQNYLTHIRALQRTNGALTKKVSHLVALQGEHTRMKLIARQQRLLREVSTRGEQLR
jgi:hypothetical protein